MFMTLKEYQENKVLKLFEHLMLEIGISLPKKHHIIFPLKTADYQQYINTVFVDPGVAAIVGASEPTLKIGLKIYVEYDMYGKKVEIVAPELAVIDYTQFKTVTLKEFIAVSCNFENTCVENAVRYMAENKIDPNMELVIVPETFPMIILY